MGLAEGLKGLWHNHALLMVLCCIIPIVLFWVLLAEGFDANSVWVIALLCPIMHIFMMRGAHEHGRHEEPKAKGV